jgi:hypothetical protein
LAEFAYFMFSKNGKSISQGELQEFLRQYKSDYVLPDKLDSLSIKTIACSNSSSIDLRKLE